MCACGWRWDYVFQAGGSSVCIISEPSYVRHTPGTIKTCFLLISNYKMLADQRSSSAELLTGLSVRQSITEDGMSKNWWKRRVQYWLSQQAKRLKSNGVCPASHWQPLLLILLSWNVLSFDLFCASWMSFFFFFNCYIRSSCTFTTTIQDIIWPVKSITHTIRVPCQISSNKEVKGQVCQMTVCSDILKQFQLMEALAIGAWDSKCLLATPWRSIQDPEGYASASAGIFSGRELGFCMMPDLLVSWYFFLCFIRLAIDEVILLLHLIFNEEKSQDQYWTKLHYLVKLLLSLSYQQVTPKIILRSFLAAECCS